jgi:hypothetical protein
VWRTAPSLTQQAVAISRVVSEISEPELRRSGVVRRGDRMRVVLLRGKGGDSISFSDAVVSTMRFNGQDVVANGDAFREVDATGAAGDGGATVMQVLEARPHVVICAIGPTTCAREVFTPLEARWPRGTPYPSYVMASTASNGVYDFAGTNAERRRRVLAVDTPANTPPNVKFALRYDDVFSPKVTPGTAPSTSYDAFYVAAYAAYALGDQPASGVGLAGAVRRLVGPGKAVDVGPGQILDVISELHAGRNVDLNGAGSALDFNLATGENSTDFAVYCLKADASGHVVDTVESGMRFDSTTGKLVGKMTQCQ